MTPPLPLPGSTVRIIVPRDNDPPPSFSLVLQLESLFLETDDPSPPLPGSTVRIVFPRDK